MDPGRFATSSRSQAPRAQTGWTPWQTTHHLDSEPVMRLSEITKALDATVLGGDDKLAMDITRCGASDLMSDILAGAADGSLLVTGLTTVQAIRTASIAGVGAVVFVRGKKPAPEVIGIAAAQGMPILSSPYSMFVTCGRLHALGLTGLSGIR